MESNLKSVIRDPIVVHHSLSPKEPELQGQGVQCVERQACAEQAQAARSHSFLLCVALPRL